MTYHLAAVAQPLNIITLGIIFVVALGAYLFFMRKKSNRHPMDTPAGEAIEKQHKREVLDERPDHKPLDAERPEHTPIDKR